MNTLAKHSNPKGIKLKISEIAMQIFNDDKNVYKKMNKQFANTLNKVLFYGTGNDIDDMRNQVGLNNIFCIYYVITHASRTIDVCVPSLVSETMAKCLVDVVTRCKVKVRIVIHRSTDLRNLQLFAQNGIDVKVIISEQLEHNFMLVNAIEDYRESVAVMGALDYDATRLNCNMDNTVLTSELSVVTALKKEFDRVWESIP